MTITTNDHPKLAVTFPGQGGYDGAALLAAYRTYPEVREIFARIDEAARELFGRALSEALFRSPPAELPALLEAEPWVSQLAIYGSGLSAYHLLLKQGVNPTVLVGHSLGEIVALVAAEAFSVEDGARITARRVMVIDEIAQSHGQMIALGTDAQRARNLVELLADPLVSIASVNHDRQTVVSGPVTPIDVAVKIAAVANIPATKLAAAFPFHTLTLAPAVEPFARYVRGFDQLPMRRPVLSPILGRYYEPDDPLGDLLSQQLVHPVDFPRAIRTLFDDGFRCFVEAGGKSMLTKLVGKILAGEDVETLSTLSMTKGQPALSGTLSRLRELGYRPAPSWPLTLTDMLEQARVPSGTPQLYAAFWAAQGAAVSAEVADRFERWSAAQLSPAMAAAPVKDSTPAAGGDSATGQLKGGAAMDRGALFEQVSQVYAEALEYPADVFAEGALLEAELGVDSVKQIEMLTRVWSKYGLPPRQDSFNLSDVDTLDKVVDHLAAELAAQNCEPRVPADVR